jgi:hypothetical protein
MTSTAARCTQIKLPARLSVSLRCSFHFHFLFPSASLQTSAVSLSIMAVTRRACRHYDLQDSRRLRSGTLVMVSHVNQSVVKAPQHIHRRRTHNSPVRVQWNNQGHGLGFSALCVQSELQGVAEDSISARKVDRKKFSHRKHNPTGRGEAIVFPFEGES